MQPGGRAGRANPPPLAWFSINSMSGYIQRGELGLGGNKLHDITWKGSCFLLVHSTCHIMSYLLASENSVFFFGLSPPSSVSFVYTRLMALPCSQMRSVCVSCSGWTSMSCSPPALLGQTLLPVLGSRAPPGSTRLLQIIASCHYWSEHECCMEPYCAPRSYSPRVLRLSYISSISLQTLIVSRIAADP